MNYYDYRSYFNEIIGQLDDILAAYETAHTELMTEIQAFHADNNTKLDSIHTTLTNGFLTLSVLLVAITAIKVFFR